jgi:hypothetical protein
MAANIGAMATTNDETPLCAAADGASPRFWNNDIFENRVGVLQIIAEALGPIPQRSPHLTLPRERGGNDGRLRGQQ